MVARGRLKPTSEIVEKLKEHLIAISELELFEHESFTFDSKAFITSKTVKTTDFLTIVDAAINMLRKSDDSRISQKDVLCTRIIWTILQMERGSLSASTLAGLDDYREDWELDAPSMAAV